MLLRPFGRGPRAQKSRHEEGAAGSSEISGVPDARYFAFLSYLIDKRKPGAMWAATTFKAIQGRNKAIKGALGDNFLTFRQTHPRGLYPMEAGPGQRLVLGEHDRR